MTNLFFIFLLFISGMVACQAENEPIAAPVEQQVTIGITRVTETPTLTATLTHPTVAPQNTPTQVTATPTVPPQGTPGFGSLTVDSNLPDALVYVNQNQVGQTPYQGYWPAGVYTITVSLPGFKSWQEQVNFGNSIPQQLTIDFAFSPHTERLLDIPIDQFWWSEDGNAIYYVKCFDTDCNYEVRHEDATIWKLDLQTHEISLLNEPTIWPPQWVPREYLPLIPATIDPWMISVSPSSQKMLYIETSFLETPNPYQDSARIGSTVYLVLDSNTTVNLGTIEGQPDRLAWSANEEFVFAPSQPFSIPSAGAWLFDLASKAIQPLNSPLQTNPYSPFFRGGFLNSYGNMILFDNPLHLWDFRSNELRVLSIDPGFIQWLDSERYFLFENNEGWFWYDLVQDNKMVILEAGNLPDAPLALSLSPMKNKMLMTFLPQTGQITRGLWLLTFDTE